MIFGGKCKNKDITHVSLECLKLLRQLRGKKPEWLPIWEWFFFFHKAFKYLCPVHTEAISVCFGLRQAYSVSYVLYMVLRICMWIHRKDFATSSVQFLSHCVVRQCTAKPHCLSLKIITWMFFFGTGAVFILSRGLSDLWAHYSCVVWIQIFNLINII